MHLKMIQSPQKYFINKQAIKTVDNDYSCKTDGAEMLIQQ
jgi:hypothetical protein